MSTPKACFKVTNENLESVMAHMLPAEHVINYNPHGQTVAARNKPIFCFETEHQVEKFIWSEPLRRGSYRVFKTLGHNPVKLKFITWPDEVDTWLKAKLAGKRLTKHRSPISGTLFFESIELGEEITHQF